MAAKTETTAGTEKARGGTMSSEERPPFRSRGPRDRARPSAGEVRPGSRPPSSRGDYRGPQRFQHAGDYEVEREWRRYEGTPQRELLRRLRESFLERALQRGPRSVPWAIEVGPGPGRFTPWVASDARRTVLFDLSRAMLEANAALSVPTFHEAPGPSIRDLAQGDAARWPFRDRCFDRVVAMGNVVGFAADGARKVLTALASAVKQDGLLVVETVSPVRRVPSFASKLRGPSGSALLRGEPSRGLDSLLAEGWVEVAAKPVPRDAPGASAFRYVEPPEVQSALERAGLRVVDRLVVAPLTGGDPEAVRRLSPSGRAVAPRLLRWELETGRRRELLTAGGHLLTCAVRS